MRNAHATLVPLSANSPWSQALGPTHFAWMFRKQSPEHWKPVTAPDLWFVYRTNPSISFWDTAEVVKRIAEFPFVVGFAYTLDETNWMADILLPECTDLESTQLIRIGGTKFIESFWDHEGFALRQPAVKPRGETRDFTDIATELAARTGLLEKYNNAINRGAACTALAGKDYDFALDPAVKHSAEEIWDRMCRAASAEVTDGEASEGLDWYREHGYRTRPISRLAWYLFPGAAQAGHPLRDAVSGTPAADRRAARATACTSRASTGGTRSSPSIRPCPRTRISPASGRRRPWRRAASSRTIPFWLITARSMQYAWGSNVGIQLMDEVAGNLKGHRGVVINARRARELGIEDGDTHRSALLRGQDAGAGGAARRAYVPDTLLMIGQFNHWATPYAKDMNAPSMNPLLAMSMALTDATGSSADLVRVGVSQSARRRMTRWAMAVDLRRCIGCQTCTTACRRRTRRRRGVQWRQVLDMETGEYPDVRRAFVPVGCMHCADPPCEHVCPTTATHKRADGLVTIDYDICIGCGYCAVACPYQARHIIHRQTFAYGDDGPMESEAARVDPERMSVATKCTFCMDRIDAGLAKGLTPGVDPGGDAGLRQLVHHPDVRVRRP